MKKNLKISIIVIFIILFAYKITIWYKFFWVEEGLPKSSPNIEFSKENGLFIRSFKQDSFFDKINVKEAWVEYIWSEKIINGEIKKIKTNKLQLDLKFKNIPNYGLYWFKWQLKDKNTGEIFSLRTAKSNPLYFLNLSNYNNVPDNFTLEIYKRNKESYIEKLKEKIYEFYLNKE